MKHYIFFFLSFCFPLAGFTQISDFITVKKKNNRTVKSYFPGTQISLQTVYGNYINGLVKAIRNDSIFVTQYDVRAIPNMWGTSSIDTVGSFDMATHYKDISQVLFDKKESFSFVRNGTIFIIGGVGYIVLNLVNGKYLHESNNSSENKKSLAIAMGTIGAGFILRHFYRRGNRFDKKYRIEYIPMKIPQPKSV